VVIVEDGNLHGANGEWRIANSISESTIRHSLFAIRRLSPKENRALAGPV
jgi:hypothetical protein